MAGHVEHAPDLRAALLDVALAVVLATVPCVGSQAYHGAGLPWLHLTDFRHLRPHRPRRHLSYTLDLLHPFHLCATRCSLHKRTDLALHFGELFVQQRLAFFSLGPQHR
jgi:hypothetical protein